MELPSKCTAGDHFHGVNALCAAFGPLNTDFPDCCGLLLSMYINYIICVGGKNKWGVCVFM